MGMKIGSFRMGDQLEAIAAAGPFTRCDVSRLCAPAREAGKTD
jgi:hypothetical protein